MPTAGSSLHSFANAGATPGLATRSPQTSMPSSGSREFTREWIWFEESPPEETVVERRRFADYGYPVCAANLRSEKLRTVLRPGDGGFALDSFGEDTRWVPELLRRCWLSPDE